MRINELLVHGFAVSLVARACHVLAAMHALHWARDGYVPISLQCGRVQEKVLIGTLSFPTFGCARQMISYDHNCGDHIPSSEVITPWLSHLPNTATLGGFYSVADDSADSDGFFCGDCSTGPRNMPPLSGQ